jgi:hypothetical protein
VVRIAIEEQMVNRLRSGIGENTMTLGEWLSEEARRLRPDLNFIANTHGTRFTVIINISCAYGQSSYGENTLEKVDIDKLEKYARLAQEVKMTGDMPVKIISVIVSFLGAVHEHSLKALG